MMEKRNFVTEARTAAEGAAELDEILSGCAAEFGLAEKKAGELEKKASAEDENADKE